MAPCLQVYIRAVCHLLFQALLFLCDLARLAYAAVVRWCSLLGTLGPPRNAALGTVSRGASEHHAHQSSVRCVFVNFPWGCDWQ